MQALRRERTSLVIVEWTVFFAVRKSIAREITHASNNSIRRGLCNHKGGARDASARRVDCQLRIWICAPHKLSNVLI
eukprot:1077181-Pleurochrysis_carterae.AAC.1